MARAAGGDATAEAAFVARTIDDVWRYCAHLLGPGQADDATQATFLRALRSLGNYRGEAAPRTWLIGVARNTCLDERRSQARRIRLVERIVEQPAEVSSAAVTATTWMEADDLLANLPEDRREAFALTQFLGFGYEEAAALLGCPVGTIRSRVARARAELAAQVDRGEADHG